MGRGLTGAAALIGPEVLVAVGDGLPASLLLFAGGRLLFLQEERDELEDHTAD